MQDRKNEVATASFSSHQRIEFLLRPLLFYEVWAKYDQPVAGEGQPAFNRAPQAVTYFQSKLVIPDTEISRAKCLGERSDERLVLPRVANEDVPLHD